MFRRIVALAVLSTPALSSSPLRSEAAYRDYALFTISKSENRNEVQYAIRLDTRCAPLDDTAVFAYWRMHEKGESVTEPLLAREQRAYGIGPQLVSARSEGGAQVRVALRALPSRPLVVQTFRTSEGCGARAEMHIAGAAAQLQDVHAVLAWPFGIDHLLIAGWSLPEGRPLREIVRP